MTKIDHRIPAPKPKRNYARAKPIRKVEKPKSCKTCPLYTADGIVWGQGPSDAKMMLVGEAPGEHEADMGFPFVGGSGRVLNALLQHAGVRRDEVFVTNVVKCRPTSKHTGRVTNRQPTESEIRHCARFLLHELKTVNPNVVVPLGNVPLHALTTRKKGIMTERSVPHTSILRSDGKAERYKAVATFHPAYVMRAQDLWPAVVFDLARARTESATPVLSRRPWKYHIHASVADVGESLLRRIKDIGRYRHDLETTGLDASRDAIRCIGIAAGPDEVYCFDWTNATQRFVRDLHGDPELCCVGQNSEAFDIPFQEAKGIEFQGPTYDTMAGWHLLNSALPKDLGFIGASCTDLESWKDETMYRAGEDALQIGCCKDVHATARADEDQHVELERYGQLELYYNQYMPLFPILRRMTARGVRKNIKKAGGWHIALSKRAAALTEKLRNALADSTLDINSPKQLMDLLYNKMGLEMQFTKSKDGYRPTVNADALDALALKYNNPVLKLIRTIRTLQKWDSTYVRCPHDEDGFVHPKFGISKAATGRFNSTEPNAQNWPSPVRELIEPDDEDHVFIGRDWSQVEWRVAMALSGEERGLAALSKGLDPHIAGYAAAFHKQYADVAPRERYEAKFINYGLMYGRGAESISKGRAGHAESALPLGRVTTYIEQFFQAHPSYKKYRELLEERVKANQYIATPWGRRRWWYTRQLPEIYNFPIQGSAAHMMVLAILLCEAQLPKEATLRMTIHDELVLCVPKERSILRQAIECTKDVMEMTFDEITEGSERPEVVKKYYPNGWYCPSDWNIGRNWKELKPDTKKEKEEQRALKAEFGVADLA